MKMKKLNATSLRSLLITLLILVVATASGVLFFTFGSLKDYADEVNKAVIHAHETTAPTTSTTVAAQQAALDQQGAVVQILADFTAPLATFQTQAIQDINTYARLSGLAVTNVSANPGTPSLTVTLGSPVSYDSLLKFMTYVQNNLPKMRPQGLTIQRIAGASNTVAITSMVIEVEAK